MHQGLRYLFAFLILLSGGVLQAGSYTLSFFPGPSFGTGILFANGVNTQGEIIGNSVNSSALDGYLRMADGEFTTINVPNSNVTLPKGINDSGQVVGTFYDSTGQHAFLRQPNGTYQTLHIPYAQFGFLSTYFETVSAVGINNAGDIVGNFDGLQKDGSVFSGAFLMRLDGTFRAIIPSNGTYVSSISNNGYILGTYVPLPSLYSAFVMNTSGQIVDTITNTPEAYGYGLAILSSINRQGDIIGSYDSTYGAFITNINGHQFSSLPSPKHCQTGGINDNGVIVGFCQAYVPAETSSLEGLVGFELTPTGEPSSESTPEPASLGMVSATLLICGMLKWRSR